MFRRLCLAMLVVLFLPSSQAQLLPCQMAPYPDSTPPAGLIPLVDWTVHREAADTCVAANDQADHGVFIGLGWVGFADRSAGEALDILLPGSQDVVNYASNPLAADGFAWRQFYPVCVLVVGSGSGFCGTPPPPPDQNQRCVAGLAVPTPLDPSSYPGMTLANANTAMQTLCTFPTPMPSNVFQLAGWSLTLSQEVAMEFDDTNRELTLATNDASAFVDFGTETACYFLINQPNCL